MKRQRLVLGWYSVPRSLRYPLCVRTAAAAAVARSAARRQSSASVTVNGIDEQQYLLRASNADLSLICRMDPDRQSLGPDDKSDAVLNQRLRIRSSRWLNLPLKPTDRWTDGHSRRPSFCSVQGCSMHTGEQIRVISVCCTFSFNIHRLLYTVRSWSCSAATMLPRLWMVPSGHSESFINS